MIFPSFCNHKIFTKLNLPIFLVLVGQQEKSQKYFDLSAFNQNLNDSNPYSSLGALNFQKWKLFSGSPGRPIRNFDIKVTLDQLHAKNYDYFLSIRHNVLLAEHKQFLI